MPDSNPEPLRVPVGIALLMTNEPRHLLIKLILKGGVHGGLVLKVSLHLDRPSQVRIMAQALPSPQCGLMDGRSHC